MLRTSFALTCILVLAASTPTQVHYHDDGRPWTQKAGNGPDEEVPGWFYNIGETGLRVELVSGAPTHLVVRYVFAGSPAARKVKVGDHIVGANGTPFRTPHQNGYGTKVFGPTGPILDFANALEHSTSKAAKGKLSLQLERGSATLDVTIKLTTKIGNYSDTFPANCKKSDRVLRELLDYLVEQQLDDGSWGSPPRNMFAPLALPTAGPNESCDASKRKAQLAFGAGAVVEPRLRRVSLRALAHG